MYKQWLQEYVSRYGIDLSEWVVTLESRANYPSMRGGYLPSKNYLLAVMPFNDDIEIMVDDVWIDDDGSILQYGAITLG